MKRPRRHHLAACCAAFALALAWPPGARADREELTIALRPAGGVARVAENGTGERVRVRSRGLAGGASWGVRNWLDLGGELAAGYLDQATYQMATLPVGTGPLSGPLTRTTRTAQLRGVATVRLGVAWVPTVQLAFGAGARYRTTAMIYSPTVQGERWLPADDEGESVTLDLVTGIRAGFERRLTIHWTIGVSAGVSRVFGLGTPDLQTTDANLSFSYSWYPVLSP